MDGVSGGWEAAWILTPESLSGLILREINLSLRFADSFVIHQCQPSCEAGNKMCANIKLSTRPTAAYKPDVDKGDDAFWYGLISSAPEPLLDRDGSK